MHEKVCLCLILAYLLLCDRLSGVASLTTSFVNKQNGVISYSRDQLMKFAEGPYDYPSSEELNDIKNIPEDEVEEGELEQDVGGEDTG